MPYRVGTKLKTTIYRDDQEQPCAWVPGDPELALAIVEMLNGRDRLRKALEKLPHEPTCASLQEVHQSGYTHYESDAGEPCPLFHFARGKCDCAKSVINQQPKRASEVGLSW